jgi:hypothetical protein
VFGYCSKAKILFQSSFMLMTIQPFFFASAMQIHSDTRHWGYFQLGGRTARPKHC